MSKINKKPHKIEGKIVYYFNGEKWLVREYCKTEKEAKELLTSIQKENG